MDVHQPQAAVNLPGGATPGPLEAACMLVTLTHRVTPAMLNAVLISPEHTY